MSKNYGQFCGLAKASSLVSERWTLLVLRDLSVGPRRFTELQEGLPGVPTSLLTTRLRDLEAAHVIGRAASAAPGGGVHYALTQHGEALIPILDALGRWGAQHMATPEEHDVITGASLAAALRAGYRERELTAPTTYQLHAGPVSAWAVAGPDTIEVGTGAPPTPPHLTIYGDSRLRLLLAGELTAAEALATDAAHIEGERDAFAEFTRAFRVPLTHERIQ